MHYIIRLLRYEDIPIIVEAFNAAGWPKPPSLFESYYQDLQHSVRVVWIAWVGRAVAGYVTLKLSSSYPFFQDNHIPEINDLNVLPQYRKLGIGSSLLDYAEARAVKEYSSVGIGVGLYADYGAAQRLYIKRGYIPDGRGVTYDYHLVEPGETVVVDDDLVLWFVKRFDDEKK
jgi:GNAT superfamily N-acetyltransferase